MENNMLDFFVEYRINSDTFVVHIVTRDASGSVNAVASNIEFVPRTPDQRGTPLPGPVIETDMYTLQKLMDGLWNSGARPSGQRQTDAEREAYKDHIADLRMVITRTLPNA